MWNSVSCNVVYKRYLKEKQDENLRKNIIHAKPMIDTKPPKSFTHSINFSKKHKITEKQEKIHMENQVLLKKMLTIDSKPSALNSQEIAQAVRFQGTLNLPLRNRILSEIKSENTRLFKRIRNAQSQYSIVKWEESNAYLNYIKSNIRRNSGRIDKKYFEQQYEEDSEFYTNKVLRPLTSLHKKKWIEIQRPSTKAKSDV
ncbi:unnamed protein product [Blepharisma stoltei]|uniref:Uncharacterized protein n=1 Tax=Blepharisma stoltei TaxID=1481888 RepID=A0AAU9IPU6_9CILI|nr:unnamed protein product [Blepharisma stoltei]